MTWVKICGITNLEDAVVAVEAGADAVGFVFYENSPRCVSVEAVREIVRKLPQSVEKVGVFVGQTVSRIDEVGEHLELNAVQVYPGAAGYSVEAWKGWRPLQKRRIIVAIAGENLRDDENLPASKNGSLRISSELKGLLHAFLIDSGAADRPGGTGTMFDWDRCRIMVRGLSVIAPVIIAGGLTPLNVTEAMSAFEPFGVDVVSGVEARPGKKDPVKVRAFVRAVREFDRKVS